MDFSSLKTWLHLLIFPFIMFAPFVWAWFHLGPSNRKPDMPMNQFMDQIEKAKRKAQKKMAKKNSHQIKAKDKNVL